MTHHISLQVLELTDVALDDGMLNVLGEVLTSPRRTSPSSSSAAMATAGASSAAASGRGGGGGAAGEDQDAAPSNIFFPPNAKGNGISSATHQRRQEREGTSHDGGGEGEGRTVSLRTLILGRCGSVSEAAFEKFLDLAGGGVGSRMAGARGSSEGTGVTSGGGDIGSRNTSRSQWGRSGGGNDGRDAAAAAGVAGGGAGLALSTLRLQGCWELGDRGLALFCAGARERLSDIQVRVIGVFFFSGEAGTGRQFSRKRL